MLFDPTWRASGLSSRDSVAACCCLQPARALVALSLTEYTTHHHPPPPPIPRTSDDHRNVSTMSLSPVSSPPSSPGYSSSPNDSDDSVCFTTTQPRRTGTTKGTGTTVNKRKLRYSRRDTLILPREALKEVNGSKVDVSSTTSSRASECSLCVLCTAWMKE